MRILNVGCGYETYGTDFVDLYPQRPEVKKCNIDEEPLPFKDETFDIVYSKNVFEHLTKPGFALKEMARVLKKKGKLILITDNASYWVWSVGKTHLGGYEESPQGGKEDRHYSLFTEWHLKNHFQKVGLKPVKIEYLEEEFLHKTIFGRIIKKIVNGIIRLTKFKRMGYAKIKIIGVKLVR
ncbi:MAG: class I SAM-dependent methyltransferase [Candidatus Ratteibacteria bacterium]